MATANLEMKHGPAWRVRLAIELVRWGLLRLACFVLDGTYLETPGGSRAYLDATFLDPFKR